MRLGKQSNWKGNSVLTVMKMRKRMTGMAPVRTRMTSVLGLQGKVCAANAAMMPTIKSAQVATIEACSILQEFDVLNRSAASVHWIDINHRGVWTRMMNSESGVALGCRLGWNRV